MGFVKPCLWASVCLLFSACSSGMRAGLLTIQQEVLRTHQSVRQTQLQSGYRYLLIERNGQEALLVWVSQEAGPMGDTSVWVSADGVIFRLAQGRLVGVSEPLRNWSLISEVPSPPLKVGAVFPTRFIQTSDMQPGFRLGTVHPTLRRPVQPQTQFRAWIEGGEELGWVEDIESDTGQPLAWYAINLQGQTIAGRRCITPEWCYSWQVWPAPSNQVPS